MISSPACGGVRCSANSLADDALVHYFRKVLSGGQTWGTTQDPSITALPHLHYFISILVACCSMRSTLSRCSATKCSVTSYLVQTVDKVEPAEVEPEQEIDKEEQEVGGY